MLKRFIFIMAAIALVVSGIPATASAKTPCPMMKMMDAGQMASMPDCHKMQGKKSGCCDEKNCGTQCSATVSMHHEQSFPMHAAPVKMPGHYTHPAALASQLLNTQERPPKSLA